MVPIKEAVSSGAWLKFSSDYDPLGHGLIKHFRVRILSFSKINLDAVDSSYKIDSQYSGAAWWLMRLELINLCKKQVNSTDFTNSLRLIDEDEFEFEVVQDTHLSLLSEYAEKAGLDRFFAGELYPKIKALGAITFFLPDEEDMEYSLSMERGIVCEA